MGIDFPLYMLGSEKQLFFGQFFENIFFNKFTKDCRPFC